MSYIIISKEQQEDSIITVVKFDSIEAEVTIVHFQPENKEAVILGIENREASERRKFDAIEKNKIIINQI